MNIGLEINGKNHEIDIQPGDTLNFILREKLNLTGTKKGCDAGGCGACTVIVNGKALYSCMTYAAKIDNANVITVEGLGKAGQLDRIQAAYVEHYALQCGYCTPGFVMSTKALLDKVPNPSESEVKEALVGNLCRCTGYTKIVQSVMDLASRTKGS